MRCEILYHLLDGAVLTTLLPESELLYNQAPGSRPADWAGSAGTAFLGAVVSVWEGNRLASQDAWKRMFY
jgi:hypothetical protein